MAVCKQHYFFSLCLAIMIIDGWQCVEHPMDEMYQEEHRTSKPTTYARVHFIPLDGTSSRDSSSHPCKRKCILGETMTCQYHFNVELYYTMSKACYECPTNLTHCLLPDCIPADGEPRSIVVVNRQLPGPSIELCKDDQVIIVVHNHLLGETTSMHWHGHHQVGTPYMDGVPGVTQCPINSDTSFTYRFTASNAGTHFWHSHTGIQRGDGTHGAFIVHVPEETDPHRWLYDFDLSEHILTIHDWDKETSTNMFLRHYHHGGTNKPAKLLINGLGIRNFNEFTTENSGDVIANQAVTPVARFRVQPGKRYRFRLINAGFLNCPIETSIDGHSMLVIATDGNYIEPVRVESLVSYAGERFDFIVHADQLVPAEDSDVQKTHQDPLFWVRFRGLMDCDARFTSAHQIAVLEYNSAAGIAEALGEEVRFPSGPVPTFESSHKQGLQMNPLNKGMESAADNATISIPELRSIDEYDESSLDPDEKLFISYDFYKLDTPMYHRKGMYGFHQVPESKRVLTPQLNHIAFKLPPSPLLPARHEINDTAFCNETTEARENKDCKSDFCACLHVIQVKLNAIVELILVDAGFAYDANHPFHLHGHSFRVIGMERLSSNITVEEVKKLDAAGRLKRNLKNPPVKDTVTIPDGGYTIVRFNASNPGYWLFHCHIDFHVEVGMALVFKFGENEDMAPVPKGFPACGSFPMDVSYDERTSAGSAVFISWIWPGLIALQYVFAI